MTAKSSVDSVRRAMITQMQIPLPPDITEQYKISEALSDSDSQIQSLENLITKKRDVKQGTMQELLTGKTRLPGFTEKWILKRVSSFGTIVTGSTPLTHKPEFWGGNIPWITPTDITNRSEIFTSERQITIEGLDSIRILPENSVLVTCIASIGKNVILRKLGSCNQQINAIIPNQKYSTEFLYFLFENNKSFMIGNAGITATMIISKTDFEKFTFLVPNSLEEQEAIAEVLSDMDTEIAVLGQLLEKTKAIKQGMMQQLLTGRIRLVEPSTPVEASA
jgi:type I restriction enzyme, S subunit